MYFDVTELSACSPGDDFWRLIHQCAMACYAAKEIGKSR